MDFLGQCRGECPSPAFPPLTKDNCPAWHCSLCYMLSHLTVRLILSIRMCTLCPLVQQATEAQRGKVACPSSHNLSVEEVCNLDHTSRATRQTIFL